MHLKTAAENGEVNAQLKAGMLYYKGQGVPRSYEEAAKWFKKAADSGQVNAQVNFGILYHKGQGVPQNDTEAVKWLQKAADKDHPKAKRILKSLEKEMSEIDDASEERSYTYVADPHIPDKVIEVNVMGLLGYIFKIELRC